MKIFSKEDFAEVAEMFYKIRTDKQGKLQFGASKRLELKEQLDKGVEVNHYRIQWLRETRDDLVRFLSNKAAEFNKKFPHDGCSVLDLIDVTTSTIALLRKCNESKD